VNFLKDLTQLEETPLEKSVAYKGKFLDFHLDRVLLPNGETTTREYLHHPGAVAAIPLLDNGEIILVKQFRYPTGKVLLEIPAGKLESGEEPEECVRRELIEEIGYDPGRITHLISVWTTPGFTDEIIHLYLATDLKPCSGNLDSDEFLEVIKMKKEELLEQINSHTLMDGKTSLALAIMGLKGLW
jgi:ADP-ribose pyrophosphatase